MLHAVVEILDAERQTVEPETANKCDLFGRRHAWIDLDRLFGVWRDAEMAPNRGVERGDLRGR